MKKILIINTLYREFGGEDSNIIDEIALLKKQFEIKYVEFNNSDKLSFRDFMGFFLNSNKTSNQKILDAIEEFKPDIAYVHNPWFKCNLGVFKILKLKNIKTLHKIHNYRFDCSSSVFAYKHLKDSEKCNACGFHRKTLLIFNKYYEDSYLKSLFLIIFSKRYLNIIKNYPVSLLVLSKFQKDYLTNLNISRKKIFIYPNPVSMKISNFNSYSSDNETVVYAGRIVDSKGVDKILTAWKNVSPKNMKLTLIGSGNSQEKLKNSVQNDSIEFLDQMTNVEVKKIIKKARAIITATQLYEGQPRLLLEASSYGVPSIYPSFGGMNDFFPDGYLLSFEQFNYKSLEDKIRLLENKEILNSMHEEISKFMNENFNEDKLLILFENIATTCIWEKQ